MRAALVACSSAAKDCPLIDQRASVPEHGSHHLRSRASPFPGSVAVTRSAEPAWPAPMRLSSLSARAPRDASAVAQDALFASNGPSRRLCSLVPRRRSSPLHRTRRSPTRSARAYTEGSARRLLAATAGAFPRRKVPANMSFNRTRHGMPPSPRAAQAHHASRGLGAMPRRAG
jgi:hypothetical protein